MIDREIVFIVYVSDIEASASSLALWTGASNALHETSIRTSEVCINLKGSDAEILTQYQAWVEQGVVILEEPHRDVFGMTFVASDLDGNRIRVAPTLPFPHYIYGRFATFMSRYQYRNTTCIKPAYLIVFSQYSGKAVLKRPKQHSYPGWSKG